jgi:tyrosyl-tRNA synthetase
MTSKSQAAEVERQLAAMLEGVVACYGEDTLRVALAKAIAEGRPLRVKLGMDPSAPDLHLGHTVVLTKLKRFQELGHTPIFLIGDFTARIGDPSGKKKTRPALAPEQVAENSRTYIDQAARVLDTQNAEIRFNSEWMDAMTPTDFVHLCAHGTVARLLERDDFHKRYSEGSPIAVHEFLYPYVQAYDSVALEADVELGGTDQTFNLLMAREVQRSYGQAPQAVLTHPLLVGVDGSEKMSKSLGNTIDIDDPPEEIYGKVMSISDSLMLEYHDLLHGGAWEDLVAARAAFEGGSGDPLAFKHGLARRLAERFGGEGAGKRAADHFARVVTRKQTPDDVPEARLPLGEDGRRGLVEILEAVGLVGSRSEARRLVAQNAVQVDGERVKDPSLSLGAGSYLLKVGKRRFSQVTLD